MDRACKIQFFFSVKADLNELFGGGESWRHESASLNLSCPKCLITTLSRCKKTTQFLVLNVLNCCKSLPAHKHNLICSNCCLLVLSPISCSSTFITFCVPPPSPRPPPPFFPSILIIPESHNELVLEILLIPVDVIKLGYF